MRLRLSARLLPLVAGLLAGCAAQPLEHTQPSADALGREVLAALSSRDAPRLAALALSEREFQERIWPELPAARPERNLPWSYVWLDLRQKSDARLQRSLAEHGGHRYQLDAVRFAGPVTDHGGYRVHRGTVLAVRDGARATELRVLGSMVEANGRWKVFSYLVDE